MEIHELKIDRNFNNHLSNRVVCMLRAYREVYVPQNLFYLSALHAGEYVRSVVYVLVHVEQVSMRQLSDWDCLCYCGYTKADFETIASRLMPTKSIHNMSWAKLCFKPQRHCIQERTGWRAGGDWLPQDSAWNHQVGERIATPLQNNNNE